MKEHTFIYKELISESEDDINAFLKKEKELKAEGFVFNGWLPTTEPMPSGSMPTPLIKLTYTKSVDENE